MGSAAGLGWIAFFVIQSHRPFEMYYLVPALLIALLMSLGIMTAATMGRGFAFVTGLLLLVYAALAVTAGLLAFSIFMAAHFTVIYEKLWGDYAPSDSLWPPNGRLAAWRPWVISIMWLAGMVTTLAIVIATAIFVNLIKIVSHTKQLRTLACR